MIVSRLSHWWSNNYHPQGFSCFCWKNNKSIYYFKYPHQRYCFLFEELKYNRSIQYLTNQAASHLTCLFSICFQMFFTYSFYVHFYSIYFSICKTIRWLFVFHCLYILIFLFLQEEVECGILGISIRNNTYWLQIHISPSICMTR